MPLPVALLVLAGTGLAWLLWCGVVLGLFTDHSMSRRRLGQDMNNRSDIDDRS